jgi:hypothetical protein
LTAELFRRTNGVVPHESERQLLRQDLLDPEAS